MSTTQYRGETPAKTVTRVLVWRQHQRLLGRVFISTPHVFLASSVAGDVDTLRGMSVPMDKIWAVEKERAQYEGLLGRQGKEGFWLFTEKVETVVERHTATTALRSIYLDHCGTLPGTESTRRRVVSQLLPGSVLSVTLLLGREHEKAEDREAALLQSIKKHTRHKVTLVQSIHYTSISESSIGLAMGIWTFYIGAHESRTKMRFDLRQHSNDKLKELAASLRQILSIWGSCEELAEKRTQAAARANETRGKKGRSDAAKRANAARVA